MNIEQNKTNKRSGKKCADYEKLEQKFQEVQSKWELTEAKMYWDEMFMLIQLAVFNNINQKLERVLDKEEIEQRALDITMNILQTMLKKKKNNKDWKIKKVSSAVYLPCLAIYNKQLQFEDKIINETDLEDNNNE